MMGCAARHRPHHHCAHGRRARAGCRCGLPDVLDASATPAAASSARTSADPFNRCTEARPSPFAS
ncbi:hypothetical protein MYA_4169 [Burkholderia sp. KJ006]|nr:hypothetical protein MYA_4169 [Burkholderia sp. KJ006]